ncbi:ABC transporter permease [Paenibacillus sp. PK4536]|uniref:Oligopeptide transport system permease protein AppC n=1 Tax=Paenibacillus nuruki TaxID=1886670 RepID=A0A1E3L7Y5_9BACL|nr:MULTISPECIES: ABC transporter permease [Paenibacillus]ODP29922.1 Oligopeptide transport system permease protein AppC [Paenibacillus nuruki]TKJ93303.1 ABC transporter permease [Paenibacillus sp. CFBP13512]WIM41364.1 ABC transporter permease [Paenibacillus sp. PK4536]CAJ1316275.1 Oligopeptide transport system permease protein AppC [Paenibacillus nuruki]
MTQASLNTGSGGNVKEVKSGPWRDGIRSFMRNKTAVVGFAIVVFFIILALLAPLISPYDYKAQVLSERLQAPSATHWFGTDDLGRDILTRTLYGARISLWVGFVSVIGSIIIGTFLGILAGFYGRWVDMIISRVFDILLAFPAILLAIAIVAILGPSLQNALYAIAIVNIPTYGRLVRSRVLSLRQEEFITAARATGVRDARILFRHILPNSLTPIIVQGTLGVATAIIEAAGLGFLGMGAQPPEPEWGKMLSDSRQFIQTAPWTVIFPGVSILLTSLGFNLMGDGLRDTFDPRMKR